MSHAGEFADGFRVCFERCSGGGHCAFEAECAKGTVDGAAGADALDDLLAEVAAFAEVQGARLSCLLWQLAVANVDAVTRRSFEGAELLDCGLCRDNGSGGVEGGGNGGDGGGVGPEFKAWDERAVGVQESDFAGLPGEGLELQRFE